MFQLGRSILQRVYRNNIPQIAPDWFTTNIFFLKIAQKFFNCRTSAKLEDWLIVRAKSSGIRPEDYGLPSDPDRLHAIPRYERKEGFHRFLTELIEQDKGLHLLRRWILEEES